MSKELDEANRRDLLSSVLSAEDFRPAASVVQAEFAARSHHGLVRVENEDHFLVLRLSRHQEALFTSLDRRDLPGSFDESAYCAVLADGIGRGGAGALAARLAVSTLAHLAIRFGKWNMRIDPKTASEILERSEWFYRRTHETILKRSREDAALTGMGTTMTGIYSTGNDLFVAHVGHSRCYLFRRGFLTQLTRDQTLEERLSSSPQPMSFSCAMEDLRHILTDVLGVRTEGPIVAVDHIRLADGDTVLLCTNGLSDMVSDNQIAEVLTLRRRPAEQCDLLVDMALANGGKDNVTVVLANYQIPEVRSVDQLT
jgi:protein phosphatase